MENENTKGLELGESCVVSHLTEEELEESFFEYLTRYLVPRFLAKTECSEVMKEELAEGMCSQIELAGGYGELDQIFMPMLLKLKKDTIRTIQDHYDMYKEEEVYTKEFLEEFEGEKLLYCDVDNLYPDTECLNSEWLWENGFGSLEKKQGFDYSNRYIGDKITELTGVKFEQVAYAESAGNPVEYYFYCKREDAEILKSKAADIKQMVEELEGCTITVTVCDGGIETDPAVLVLTLVLD